MAQSDIGTFRRIDDNTIEHEYTRWRKVKVDQMWNRAKEAIDQLEAMPEYKTLDDKEAERVYNEWVEQERAGIPSLVSSLEWIVYWANEIDKQGVLTETEQDKLKQLNETLEKWR